MMTDDLSYEEAAIYDIDFISGEGDLGDDDDD